LSFHNGLIVVSTRFSIVLGAKIQQKEFLERYFPNNMRKTTSFGMRSVDSTGEWAGYQPKYYHLMGE